MPERPDGRSGVDAGLVKRLIGTQFPQWADLPVVPVEVDGWDNRTFHLGDDMTVRLPSGAGYVLQVAKEHRWLPVLAPQLPLPIPVPLAMGRPALGYPYDWSVYRWIDGVTARPDRIDDLPRFATAVGEFLTALQLIDATDGPAAGPHNFYRGGPLTTYDAETRTAIAGLGARIDGAAATAVWETALATTWPRPPVWIHGDIAVGNLLVRDGRLAAVIDFGTSGVGDPACDLVIAWTLLSGASRQAFRAAIAADAGTWARARAWALWKALITFDAGTDVDPAGAATNRHVIDEVISEHRSSMPGTIDS
jgi:aminoglycoside phosphotransferase (APT) family kinase protein